MTGTAIRTNGEGRRFNGHLNLSTPLSVAWEQADADRRALSYGRRRVPTAVIQSAPLDMLAAPSWEFLRAYVSAKHGVGVREIASPSRRRVPVKARNELAWLMRTHVGYSLDDIGYFIERDHSTVRHSIDQHRQTMEAAQ